MSTPLRSSTACFRADQLEGVKSDLENIVAWPAIFAQEYAKNINGDHLTKGTHREQVAAIENHIEVFKKENGLERVVMVNLASTEKWLDRVPAYATVAAFEKALDANDPAISPTMRYFYAANRLGVPHVNFAPSLANIPALIEHADKCKNPYAGMDGKTGQTLVKTVARVDVPRPRASTSRAGTRRTSSATTTASCSTRPSRTRPRSCRSSRCSTASSATRSRTTRFTSTTTSRAATRRKRGTTSISSGFADMQMQMKIDFLCQDSALAAPLVLDLVRLLDLAKQRGEAGPQEQLSMFFKSPYTRDGNPVHDFFKQERMLLEWVRK